MIDYFGPILRRLLSVTAEVQDLARVIGDARQAGDTVSADIEQFMSDLDAAHQANMKAYATGLKLSAGHDKLALELARLQSAPGVAEKAGDLGSMALMMKDVISQNYIEAAITLGQLDIALYELMFRELASYDGWPEKQAALRAALEKNK
ncbi:MAG: hypothetical protein BroJett011_62650 [Chloroflexota bacterium]|nr:MAG: hypothetical protein BroJett011_62650 [Chloroflexota bacterium]